MPFQPGNQISSSFTQERADALCALLTEGKSLREACEQEGIHRGTVYRWLAAHESFRAQYAEAKKAGIEMLAEEIIDIADDGRNDWMESLGEDKPAGYTLNGEHVQRSKLRIEARKWLLVHLLPHKYGELVKHEHAGPNGGAIIQRIERVVIDPANPDA